MRFAFADEHLALRDAVRQVLAKECTPDHIRASWDSETGRSSQRWKALAGLGVVGALIDEAHGGLGLDEIAMVLALEEAGRAGLPEPLGAVAAVAAPLLAEAAPPALAAHWLPRIAAGDAIVVFAPSGATAVDDAHVADLLLLADGSILHAVDPAEVTGSAQPGLDRSRRRFALQWHPDPRTRVAPAAREALARATDRTRLAEAAQRLGVARTLLEMATDYAKLREQFGVPIGSFQAVKHQLADVAVAVEFAAPLVYRAAWSVATGQADRSDHVAMAQSQAARAAHLAARTALQVHGAIGYTDEHDLHLWLRLGLSPAAAL